MTVQELIEALAEHGVTATAEQINTELGSTESLTPGDIPAIAEMLGNSSQGTSAGKSTKSGGRMSKAGKVGKAGNTVVPTSSTLASLPTASRIQKMDATELTAEIARLNRVDHSKRDNAMMATLAALYNRQQELTQLAIAAGQALNAGNQAMQSAYQTLNGAVVDTLNGFGRIDAVVDQLDGEGATLAASFRKSGNLSARFSELLRSDLSGAGEPAI
jgi:hypothetical protein